MFININGPPFRKWNPKDYLKLWFKDHRHADVTRSRISAQHWHMDMSKNYLGECSHCFCNYLSIGGTRVRGRFLYPMNPMLLQIVQWETFLACPMLNWAVSCCTVALHSLLTICLRCRRSRSSRVAERPVCCGLWHPHSTIHDTPWTWLNMWSRIPEPL